MSSLEWPQKHPDSENEPYFVIWCDEDGRNDGTLRDGGELQGRTISSVVWTVPTGITKISENLNAVTIKAIDYAANTVATIVFSGGTAGKTYEVTCKVTLSDGEKLAKNASLPVRAQG